MVLVLQGPSIRATMNSGLGLFRHLAFWQDTFRHRHFGTIDVFACVPFGPVNILRHGQFVSMDVLAPSQMIFCYFLVSDTLITCNIKKPNI